MLIPYKYVIIIIILIYVGLMLEIVKYKKIHITYIPIFHFLKNE